MGRKSAVRWRRSERLQIIVSATPGLIRLNIPINVLHVVLIFRDGSMYKVHARLPVYRAFLGDTSRVAVDLPRVVGIFVGDCSRVVLGTGARKVDEFHTSCSLREGPFDRPFCLSYAPGNLVKEI